MDFHIGHRISEVLALRKVTKGKLGEILGMTAAGGAYLTTRTTMNADVLQKVGNALQYNFFRHYPVSETPLPGEAPPPDPKDKTIEELNGKISDLQKQLDDCKRDMAVQQRENSLLNKINQLLEKASKKS